MEILTLALISSTLLVLALISTALSFVRDAWQAQRYAAFAADAAPVFMPEPAEMLDEPVANAPPEREPRTREPLIIKPNPTLRGPSIDKVEIRVAGFAMDWCGTRRCVERLVATAYMRNGRVMVSVRADRVLMYDASGALDSVDCGDLYQQICREVEADVEMDPLGFLLDLTERFPGDTYAAVIGQPFAVCYYREAA